LFVSPEFTRHQKGAIDFKDLPIELWEIRRYEKGILTLEHLEPLETSTSINTISTKSPTIREVAKQVKVYYESDHLKGIPEATVELFNELKRRLLSLGDVEMTPKSLYIGFKRATTFADIHVYKSQVTVWLNVKKGELDDPKAIARDVSEVGHWGNGDYELAVKPDSDLDYVMMLAKYSYNKH
jgi:predicted transport protein